MIEPIEHLDNQPTETCQECGVAITIVNASMYVGLCSEHGEVHN